VSIDRSKAGYVVAFNGATHSYDSSLPSGQRQGAKEDHVQCAFIYPRWCGDGVIDTDKSEICDNGDANGTAGNTCNATCQTVTSTLSCTNLTLLPATLSKNGGSLTATCAASVSSGTQYKLVLKQGTTTIETIPYQSLATKTFDYVIPANGAATSKIYSVQCFVTN
jgi:hypothetical protein